MKGLLKFIVSLAILVIVLYLCSGFILTELKKYALSLSDRDRAARMLYVLGEAAEFLKKDEVAAGIYEDLVAIKPMATIGSEAQFHLARCYERLGRRSDAALEYRIFIKKYPYDRLLPEAMKKLRAVEEPGTTQSE